MSEHTGGTVTYHRADWVGDVDPNFPWRVQFTPDDGPVAFTAAQGEAMGLTVTESQSKAFNVVLDELIAVEPDAPFSREQVAQSIVDMLEVAGLLRDARQDPQPTADEWPEQEPGEPFSTYIVRAQEHRRLRDADGSGAFFDQAHHDFESQSWDPQPTVDTPSDDIDFDELPIGTVLKSRTGYYCTKASDGMWWDSEERCDSDDLRRSTWRGPHTVVITGEPAPVLSPRQCLEALLAGRDDADELLHGAAESWYAGASGPRPIWWSTLRGVIGDAARGGA